MFVKEPPTDDELRARARALRHSPLTYAEVGATEGELPRGYKHDRSERVLGVGDQAWADAKVAVMNWSAHRHAGVRVVPDTPPVEGEVVMVSFKVPKAYVIGGCRVVLVVEEDDRVGFAYGTLPGHPERGEESFMVHRDEDGTVRAVITVFSKANDPLVRLGAPIARRMQKRATKQYLEGLAAT